MSIKRFFDRTVTVRRLKTVSGNRKSMQATATATGAIQSLDSEARPLQDILEGRGWRAWFGVDTDIQEGDKITDDNEQDYYVREITQRQYGINKHLEVVLEETNA